MFLDGFQDSLLLTQRRPIAVSCLDCFPSLSARHRRHIRWIACSLKDLVQYAGLVKKFLSNHKTGKDWRMAKVPNPALREAIMEIVHNQMRDRTPPETRLTLDRLLAAGHTRERAEELIACVVSSEIVEVLQEGQEYNESRFVAALRRLPKLPWDDA
jgi:hypothetical protein